jgi:hypothetical protein
MAKMYEVSKVSELVSCVDTIEQDTSAICAGSVGVHQGSPHVPNESSKRIHCVDTIKHDSAHLLHASESRPASLRKGSERANICSARRENPRSASTSTYEYTELCVRLQFFGCEMMDGDGGPPLPVMR